MAELCAPHPVMTALMRGVPLTLLADLLDAAGPDSREAYGRELADLSWLRELAYPGVEGAALDRSAAS